MRERFLRVAVATVDRECIEGSFEAAERFVVYEIDAVQIRNLKEVEFAAAVRRREACSRKPKEHTTNTRCGGRKVVMEAPDEREIQSRVKGLDGISVLVVDKQLHAYSVMELNKHGVFTVQIDRQRLIGAVLSNLQSLLQSGTPGWMEVRLKEKVRPASGIYGYFIHSCQQSASL